MVYGKTALLASNKAVLLMVRSPRQQSGKEHLGVYMIPSIHTHRIQAAVNHYAYVECLFSFSFLFLLFTFLVRSFKDS